MSRVLAIVGWLLALLAAVLALLAILSWPPGGLMFALPYVFLVLAGLSGVSALLLIGLARRISRRTRAAQPPSPAATPRG